MGAMNEPSTNGPNGRDAKGRFQPGCAPGPGNPYVRQIAAWRSAFAQTVTEQDVKAVVGVLMNAAKAGEPWAVKEFLLRVLGKATEGEDQPDPEGVIQLGKITLAGG